MHLICVVWLGGLVVQVVEVHSHRYLYKNYLCDAISPLWCSGYHTRRVIERSRVQIPIEGMDFLRFV